MKQSHLALVLEILDGLWSRFWELVQDHELADTEGSMVQQILDWQCATAVDSNEPFVVRVWLDMRVVMTLDEHPVELVPFCRRYANDPEQRLVAVMTCHSDGSSRWLLWIYQVVACSTLRVAPSLWLQYPEYRVHPTRLGVARRGRWHTALEALDWFSPNCEAYQYRAIIPFRCHVPQSNRVGPYDVESNRQFLVRGSFSPFLSMSDNRPYLRQLVHETLRSPYDYYRCFPFRTIHR